MRQNLTLLAAATVLVVGMTASYAADNAPGGTGVTQSTEGKGATNKDTSTMAREGAGSAQSGGPATGEQPGTGVEDSAQGEGATTKQGVNETKTGNGAPNMGGASADNAAGGTGVESSSQGAGSQNKN